MDRTAQQNTPVIVGIGELLWDIVSPTEKYVGGAPANFAYHSRQLGAQGVVVSGVGDDAAGRELTTLLNARELQTDTLRQDARHPTGTVTVRRDETDQPRYTIHTDVAWDFVPFDAELNALARQADAVCFGSLGQRSDVSRATIQAFLRATRPACLRIFDVNVRPPFYNRAVIETSLGLADVFKLNHEELPIMAELLDLAGDEHAVLTEIMNRYALRLVAITRGSQGSILHARFRRSEHAGYPIETINSDEASSGKADSVGAGDAFTAALTWGLLHFADLDHIHDNASRLASFVCSQPGATPLLPEELRTELTVGWTR